MSIARVPFTFASTETLSPKKIVSNFQRISKDVTDLQAQRYSYSSFVLPFDGVTSATDTDQSTFTINAPIAWDVVGVEIELYQATTATLTLTSNITGFNTMTLDALGVTTRAYKNINQNCSCVKNIDSIFTVAVSAGTIVSCKVIVHIRSSRFASAPADFSPSDVIAIASGAALSAGNLNTEFTEIETAVTADTANQDDLRIQVIARRGIVNPFPSTDDQVRLPSSGRILSRLQTVVLAAVTNDFVATVKDEGANTIGTSTVTAAGISTFAKDIVALSDTQTLNAPQTTSSDYTLDLSRSGAGTATMPFAYAVVYFL